MKFSLTQLFHREEKKAEQKLFSNIVGHDKIKAAFTQFLENKKPVNILMTGDPSTSKSAFLYSMDNHCKNSWFIDLTNASKAGMLDQLFEAKSNTEILLIDEIDKLSKADQAALFQMLENGILQQTKAGKKTRRKEFKELKVFATCNDISRLSGPLQSRFLRIFLKQYDHPEFIHICRKMADQFDITEELAGYIGQRIWEMNGYIRDYVKIANHADTKEEADTIFELMTQYGESKEEEEETN